MSETLRDLAFDLELLAELVELLSVGGSLRGVVMKVEYFVLLVDTQLLLGCDDTLEVGFSGERVLEE